MADLELLSMTREGVSRHATTDAAGHADLVVDRDSWRLEASLQGFLRARSIIVVPDRGACRIDILMRLGDPGVVVTAIPSTPSSVSGATTGESTTGA
jgi:hypothetical protein